MAGHLSNQRSHSSLLNNHTSTTREISYRPEIDGLRAVAVVAVVLFHAGIPGFGGGFVGVDIFFVISGYLISSILLSRIEKGNLSLVEFYEKRARRLLPALYGMMLISLPMAWAFMLPDPLENFGQSVAATVLFGNNVLLYLTSGYWDVATEFKPLMHTWSLGVEEQFYLVFPILLILLWKLGRNFLYIAILIIAFASLVVSTVLLGVDPEANFYLLTSRIWELLVGALGALLLSKWRARPNSALSFTGLLALVSSITLFDASTPFPGPLALIPVLGTLLIILFGHGEGFFPRLLSAKPVVGVGLMSYSIYLWHQPILSFARIYSREPLGALELFGIVVATFATGYLSWKFIEIPFRRKNGVGSRFFWTASTFTGLLLVGFGFFFHLSNGAPNRIFESQQEFERSSHEFKKFDLTDIRESDFQPNSGVKILVAGDSYATDALFLISHHYGADVVNTKLREDSPCAVLDYQAQAPELLADIFVFAFDEGHESPCAAQLIHRVEANGKRIFFLGTKHFGDNLNWISQIPLQDRGSLCQKPNQEFIDVDLRDQKLIPAGNYISFFDSLSKDGCIQITTPRGELISSDRKHLTIAGVEYVAEKVLANSELDEAIRRGLEGGQVG